MGASQTYPQERVRIFDRSGFPVAEFRASVERSLVIADEGRAEFTYPSRKTDVVNDKVLRFGNWLLVESDTLPAWVGVLDTPREWSPREVAVHAYTPEHVLGWRRGPLEVKIRGSAGALFAYLLRTMNQSEATIIQTGDIWQGGTQREETLNPSSLLDSLKRIQDRSAEQYTWRPVTDDRGKLIVLADWTQRLGTDTTALLHEGKNGGNIEKLNNILIEDGPLYNDVFVYGDGMTWTSKPSVIVTDAESIDRYGLRQVAEDNSGVLSLATLRSNGLKKLSQTSETVKTYHVNALNVGETFQYLRLGNTMKLQLENMGLTFGSLGYEATVRITGMVIGSKQKNKVELSLEDVV